MILYIYGKDIFRSRQFLQESIEKFKNKRDPQGLNTTIFNAVKENSEKIFTEMLTAPFLAEKRMVTLENVLTSNDKDFLGKIIDLISSDKIPESNIVVFWQAEKLSKVSEVKKLSNLLKKGKFIYEFDNLPQSELVSWIINEVSKRGGNIKQVAASYLARNIGVDMWFLNSLIDQFVAYKQDLEIQIKDIQLFLDEKIDDNMFNMVDSIVAGNKKLAFNLLNEQRQIGSSDQYIFSMILRQFKILLQMRDFWERESGPTSDIIAKHLKIHPFVVKKSLPLIRRFSLSELQRIYDELLDIDIKTKTGIANQSLLIDYFVGKV